MYVVYILRGPTGRHYIGQTSDLERRLAEHRAGRTPTTRRLGLPLDLVAEKPFPSRGEALQLERLLKRWKNPRKAIGLLRGEHPPQSSPD